MFIDRQRNIAEYPYIGEFYIKGDDLLPPDGDLFATHDTPGETVMLQTECDVTETSRTFSSGSITASYDVYFPAPDVIEIERGMLFRCNTFGLNVSGIVVSIGVSKIGGRYRKMNADSNPENAISEQRPGMHAYIKSFEI